LQRLIQNDAVEQVGSIGVHGSAILRSEEQRHAAQKGYSTLMRRS